MTFSQYVIQQRSINFYMITLTDCVKSNTTIENMLPDLYTNWLLLYNIKITKSVQKGDSVKFYDCDQAHKDKDYSGKNPKYYPIGTVIKVYHRTDEFENTDELCDIQIGDRVSKGHFTSGVEIV